MDSKILLQNFDSLQFKFAYSGEFLSSDDFQLGEKVLTLDFYFLSNP